MSITATYEPFINVTLADWGSIASIAGFLMTIWVLLGVRSIRSYYVIRARLPDLGKRLRKAASNLAGFLNDLPSFASDIAVELASVEATLESLRRTVRRGFKRTVTTLLKDVSRIRKGRLSEAAVRAVYVELVKLNEQIKQLQDELTWER